MQEKNKTEACTTDFLSEIKRVESYPDFERLVHVIQHVQGFIVTNIKDESTGVNDLGDEYFVEVGLLCK